MPTYEYTCEKCRKKFNLVMTITEHDRRKVKCPKCSSLRVVQALHGFFTATSKKS